MNFVDDWGDMWMISDSLGDETSYRAVPLKKVKGEGCYKCLGLGHLNIVKVQIIRIEVKQQMKKTQFSVTF